PTFLDALDPAGDELTAPAAAAIWQRLDAPTRRLIETHRDQPPPDAQRAILAGVNAALAQPDLFSDAAPPDALPAPDAAPRDAARANRAILAAALPEAVRPTPRGGGVLVADGRPDPQA